MKKKAAVVSAGWLGDAIACSAAAASLSEMGYDTVFFMRWPQLKPIFDNDKRFTTKYYGRYLTYKAPRPLFPSRYSIIAREPAGWSYEEPFTSEIRRSAGCEPLAEYNLMLSERQIGMARTRFSTNRPVISFARQCYSRAYGRDIDELADALTGIAEVQWVGLDPTKDSKKGKHLSLEEDASVIYSSDIYLGPEGGLLWLAAGLGTQCVYFTEHIFEIAKRKSGNPRIALGSKNHFPKASHIDLPPFCPNTHVIDTIAEIIKKK